MRTLILALLAPGLLAFAVPFPVPGTQHSGRSTVSLCPILPSSCHDLLAPVNEDDEDQDE